MLTLVALVVPLGLDTLAVSAVLGASGETSPRERRRLSLLFAAFEAGMPLVGLALGAPLARAVGGAAEYAAIVVLAVLGLLALRGEGEERLSAPRATSLAAVLLLGLSVSLDELALGFTLGLLRVPVVPATALVALQALVLSQVGLRLGVRAGRGAGERAERLAGVALLLLAGALLVERVAAG